MPITESAKTTATIVTIWYTELRCLLQSALSYTNYWLSSYFINTVFISFSNSTTAFNLGKNSQSIV